MTKKEFYLKTILAMAQNPNYVEVKPFDGENDEDGKEVITHTLLVDEIEMDAERLLKMTEKAWPEVFDKEEPEYDDYSVKVLLGDIAAKLSDIESDMERESED